MNLHFITYSIDHLLSSAFEGVAFPPYLYVIFLCFFSFTKLCNGPSVVLRYSLFFWLCVLAYLEYTLLSFKWLLSIFFGNKMQMLPGGFHDFDVTHLWFRSALIPFLAAKALQISHQSSILLFLLKIKKKRNQLADNCVLTMGNKMNNSVW